MTTLEDLLQQIDCCSNNLKGIDQLNFTLSQKLLTRITFNEEQYTRHLIYSNMHYAILLITWKMGQYTPFHNHPSNGCLFKVISGTLKETRILNDDKQNQIETLFDSLKGLNYINNEIAIHKIQAVSDSISLHIYSPPAEALNKPYIDIRDSF
jgi:cysteine dioxygenase